MPKPKLFARIASALTPGPLTSATLSERLGAAQEAVAVAEAAYRNQAILALSGDQAANEEAAETALAEAHRNVTRIKAALLEVQRREAEAAQRALAAAHAKEDAEVTKAWHDLATEAQAAEGVIGSFITGFLPLAKAYDRVVSLSMSNPRVRRDLIAQNIPALIANEIARQAPVGVNVPGMNAMLTHTGTKPQPLSGHFADLARAIKEGF